MNYTKPLNWTTAKKRGAVYTKKYIEQAERDAAKLQKQLTELSNSIRKAKEHLKETCKHPKGHVGLKTEGICDDYGSYSRVEYYYQCDNCKNESTRYRVGTFDFINNSKIFLEFTNREFTEPLNRVENKS